MDKLIDLIRRETGESHRQLEASLDLESHLTDRQTYRALLVRFYGIYAALEGQMEECERLHAFGYRFGERRKLLALARDLQALGMTEADIVQIAQPQIAPIAGPGDALGAAYVMEGSTLGGQVITRLIARHDESLPTAFFNVYGLETRPRWLEFLSCLEKYEKSGADPAPVAAAARTTFALFQDWLVRPA